MSDKFWEQWSSGEGKKEPDPKPEVKKDEPTSDADDILAAWLQALPPTDEPEASAGPTVAAPWPPTAPVDPFSAIASNTPGSTPPSEWDLSLDLDPPTATPPPDAPSVPPAAPAGGGLSDFSLAPGGQSAPAAPNPFAPPAPNQPADAPPPPPVASPFGPPVPPVAPPQENLQAPPLRVEVRTGRRAVEVECKGEALIGRPDATRGIHPEIDLRLDDAVSRRHAKIFIRGDHYVLTDLNSTNGTRVNGQWVQPEMEVQLKPGDEIEVGELTVIRVLDAPNPNA